jgi:hypothetical protein
MKRLKGFLVSKPYRRTLPGAVLIAAALLFLTAPMFVAAQEPPDSTFRTSPFVAGQETPSTFPLAGGGPGGASSAFQVMRLPKAEETSAKSHLKALAPPAGSTWIVSPTQGAIFEDYENVAFTVAPVTTTPILQYKVEYFEWLGTQLVSRSATAPTPFQPIHLRVRKDNGLFAVYASAQRGDSTWTDPIPTVYEIRSDHDYETPPPPKWIDLQPKGAQLGVEPPDADVQISSGIAALRSDGMYTAFRTSWITQNNINLPGSDGYISLTDDGTWSGMNYVLHKSGLVFALVDSNYTSVFPPALAYDLTKLHQLSVGERYIKITRAFQTTDFDFYPQETHYYPPGYQTRGSAWVLTNQGNLFYVDQGTIMEKHTFVHDQLTPGSHCIDMTDSGEHDSDNLWVLADNGDLFLCTRSSCVKNPVTLPANASGYFKLVPTHIDGIYDSAGLPPGGQIQVISHDGKVVRFRKDGIVHNPSTDSVIFSDLADVSQDANGNPISPNPFSGEVLTMVRAYSNTGVMQVVDSNGHTFKIGNSNGDMRYTGTVPTAGKVILANSIGISDATQKQFFVIDSLNQVWATDISFDGTETPVHVLP